MPEIPSFEEFAATYQPPEPTAIPSFDDFAKEYERAQVPVGERFANATNAFLQSLTSFPGSAVKGLGELSSLLNKLDPQFTRSQSPDVLSDTLKEAGTAVESFAETAFPLNPKLQESFIDTVVPQAFGSAAGFMAGGALGSSIKAPGSVASMLGVLVGASEGADDARAAGAAEGGQAASTVLNAALGATESIPFLTVFNRVNKATGGRFLSALKEGGVVAAEEFLQETFQQAGGNLVAKEIYDEHRPLFQGVGEAGGAGGVTGAVIGFLSGALRKHAHTATRPTKEGEEPAPTTQEIPPPPIDTQVEVAPEPQEFITPWVPPTEPPGPGSITDIIREREGAIAEVQDLRGRIDSLIEQGRVVPPFLEEDLRAATTRFERARDVSAPLQPTAPVRAVTPEDIVSPKVTSVDEAIKLAEQSIASGREYNPEPDLLSNALVTADTISRFIDAERYQTSGRVNDQNLLDIIVPHLPLKAGERMTVVSPHELPKTASAGPAVGAEGQTFNVAPMTYGQYEMLSVAARAEGKKIIVFDAPMTSRIGDAFVARDLVPDTIFASKYQTESPVATAFHEIGHLMEGNDFYDAYIELVKKNITDRGRTLAVRRHGFGPDIFREVAADIHGDAMVDPAFWSKVMDLAEKRAGESRVTASVMDFLSQLRDMILRFKQTVVGYTFRSPDGKRLAEQYVKNLEDVHNALAKAVEAKYFKQGIRPADVISELARISQTSGTQFSPRIPPPEVTSAFTELAKAQRGVPEEAMMKVQSRYVGGVLNPVVESVGDLTHRMTEMSAFGLAGQPYVQEKVNRAIRFLESRYGFEKEMQENIHTNADYYGKSPAEMRKGIYNALKEYANAHRQLPVYNELQYMAREAAVAVGERRWNDALGLLKKIKSTADLDPTAYNEKAMAYRVSGGKALPYVDAEAVTRAVVPRAETVQQKMKAATETRKAEQARLAAKRASAQPVLMIGKEKTLQFRPHLNKLVASLRQYTIVRGTGSNEAVLKELHSTMVKNILWLHDLVPPEIRERAKKWYDGANRMTREFGKKYGYTHEQAVGVTAALSPQSDWFNNMSTAERVMRIMKERAYEAWTPAMTRWVESYNNAAKGKDKARRALLKDANRLEGKVLEDLSVEDAAKFVRVFDETYHERGYRTVTPEGGFLDYVLSGSDTEADLFQSVSGFKTMLRWASFSNIEKAVSILRGAGTEEAIAPFLGKAEKVQNFYQNMLRPDSAEGFVTIDTHAMAAANLKALTRNSEEAKAGFERVGVYKLYADAYREAADKRGILPREIQSISWEAVRALFPWTSKKTLAPKVEAVWKQYRDGKLTQQAAREKIYALSGGVQKFMWEDGGHGLFVEHGGSSYDGAIADNPANRIGRTIGPTREREAVTLAKGPTILNIGLNVGENRVHDLEAVQRAVERVGAKVLSIVERQSATEATAVVEIDRPLISAQALQITTELSQEAIAQRAPTGEGELFGPKADEWGPFNADFFLMPDGSTLSKTPSEVQLKPKKIVLDHYSAVEGLTEILPKMHGTGQAGAELRRKANAEPGTYVDRSYYYRSGSKPEDRFKHQYKYQVEIDENQLIDLAGSEGDITGVENRSKKTGFIGFYNSEGADPNAVALFYPQKVLTPEAQTVLRNADKKSGVQRAPKRHTESAEFRRWFGDSKVVDANGDPLIVYHGTAHTFSEFEKSRQGTTFRYDALGINWEGAFWFTPNANQADWYARESQRRTSGQGPNILPVYLSIQNPYYYTSEMYADEGLEGIPNFIDLKEEGYDGVIIQPSRGLKIPSYVIFDAEQAKSAIGNIGAFDPANPDLRFSPRQAASPTQAATPATPAPVPAPVTYQPSNPTRLDAVIRVLQDKNIDIKRVVEQIKDAGGVVPVEVNPVLREEMYAKRTEQALTDFKTDELLPLTTAMRLKNVQLEELDHYLHARHVFLDGVNARLEAMNPTMPNNTALSGITDQEAEKVYKDGLAKLEPLAKMVDKMTAQTRKLLVDYGLEHQSFVNEWVRTYEHYVPLRREGFEEEGYGTGTGRSVRGSTIGPRLGSEREVTSILANIAQAREQTVVRGEKQKPVIAFAGLMMLHPNKEIATLAKPAPVEFTDPTTGLKTRIPGDIMTNAGVSYGAPLIRRLDPNTGLVRMYPDPAYKGRDNVVNFRMNGVDFAIVFNEENARAMEIAKAFKNLDAGQLNGFLAAVAPWTRYLASINTQYNPIFGVVNFVRDVQFAMLSLESTPLAGKQHEVLAATRASMSGIYQDSRAVRQGLHPTSPTAQLWERFQHVGGPTGYRDMFFSTSDRAKDIERMLNPKDWKSIRTPGDLGHKLSDTALFKWLSDYNQTMENAVRLGVFKTATDMGLTDIEAASYAKNITVNFNKKGQIGAQMGSLYAFFNANVQGTTRIIETVFDKNGNLSSVGKKIIAGGVLLGILQAVGLALTGFDEDDIPEFIKQRSLVLPLPGTDKGYFSIPLPLGFNILPTVGRLAAETLIGGLLHGRPNVLKHGYNLMAAIGNTFTPTGGSSSLTQEVAPTAIDPIVALESNMDWTGRPIYREDIDRSRPTPGHLRTRDSATIWAKILSRAINWVTGGNEYRQGLFSPTPDAIDFLITQATGGVGRELSKAQQTVSGLVTGEDAPPYKIPLVGIFYGSASGKGPVRDRFYETLKQINVATEEYKGRVKTKDEPREFMRDHPEIALSQMANMVKDQVSALARQKREMVKAGKSADAIRLQEDRITALMQRVNEQYDRLTR